MEKPRSGAFRDRRTASSASGAPDYAALRLIQATCCCTAASYFAVLYASGFRPKDFKRRAVA